MSSSFTLDFSRERQLKQKIEFVFGREKWRSEFRTVKPACLWEVGYQTGGSQAEKNPSKFCAEILLKPLGNFCAVYSQSEAMKLLVEQSCWEADS